MVGQIYASPAYSSSKASIYIIIGFLLLSTSIFTDPIFAMAGIVLIFIGLGIMTYFSKARYNFNVSDKYLQLSLPFKAPRAIGLQDVRGYKLEQPF